MYNERDYPHKCVSILFGPSIPTVLRLISPVKPQQHVTFASKAQWLKMVSKYYGVCHEAPPRTQREELDVGMTEAVVCRSSIPTVLSCGEHWYWSSDLAFTFTLQMEQDTIISCNNSNGYRIDVSWI
jgi:hypothetical protein